MSALNGILRPRWSVYYVIGHLPARRRGRYWSYKKASRVARMWNKRNHGPGVFEVFGPAGKEET